MAAPSAQAVPSFPSATHFPPRQAVPCTQLAVLQSPPAGARVAHTPQGAARSWTCSLKHEPLLHCESLEHAASLASVPTKLQPASALGGASHAACFIWAM